MVGRLVRANEASLLGCGRPVALPAGVPEAHLSLFIPLPLLVVQCTLAFVLFFVAKDRENWIIALKDVGHVKYMERL